MCNNVRVGHTVQRRVARPGDDADIEDHESGGSRMTARISGHVTEAGVVLYVLQLRAGATQWVVKRRYRCTPNIFTAFLC